VPSLIVGNNDMQCVLCKHGTTHPGNVTVTLERDNCIIILKDVPADICENCEEYYLSQSTAAFNPAVDKSAILISNAQG
jgi:YgiT-type zinc finger domain-containing protein